MSSRGKKPLFLFIPVIFTEAASLRRGFVETQKEYNVACRLNKQQWHKENSCWDIHLWKVKPHSKKK